MWSLVTALITNLHFISLMFDVYHVCVCMFDRLIRSFFFKELQLKSKSIKLNLSGFFALWDVRWGGCECQMKVDKAEINKAGIWWRTWCAYNIIHLKIDSDTSSRGILSQNICCTFENIHFTNVISEWSLCCKSLMKSTSCRCGISRVVKEQTVFIFCCSIIQYPVVSIDMWALSGSCWLVIESMKQSH